MFWLPAAAQQPSQCSGLGAIDYVIDVDDQTQRERILQRPAFLHKRFFAEWIPMENRYFEQYGKDADIVIR